MAYTLKRLFTVTSLAAASLLAIALGLPQPGLAQPAATTQLNILAMDDHGLTIELTAPPPQIEPVSIDGQPFQRVSLPGAGMMASPGAPQLPVKATLLAVPSTDGLSVTVLEAESQLIPNVRPAPAPALTAPGTDPLTADLIETVSPDPAIYRANAFFPVQPVRLEKTMRLREQLLAPLQFFPVQANPVSGELRVYRRIVVRVEWDLPLAAAAASPENPAVESLLKAVALNAAQINRPAARPSAPTLPPAIAATAPPALKIGVKADGLYRLTGAELAAAGFNLAGIDPRRLRLQNQGANIPCRIEGETDGVFDPADTLLFYGTALTSVYSSENIYWLSAGSAPGLRMAERSAPAVAAPTPADFPQTLHAELDTFYWQTMPNSAGQDHWFWGDRLTAPQNRNYSLGLTFISTSASTATLRLSLKGYTNTPHQSRLWLNGSPVSTATWEGQSIFEQSVTVPHSRLVDGYNIIGVEALTTTAPVDQWLVNWIEIDYHDSYAASNNFLRFAPPAAGTFRFKVTNFATSTITLLDITQPASPVFITGAAVQAEGGTFSAQFTDTAGPETRYLAISPDRFKTPASLNLDQPSAWRSSAIGADTILITHHDFLTAATRLANHRAAQGLRVVTVDITDIFDEFAHGLAEPQAIRDFLSYAYHNWTPPAPAYVLLVGDGHQDYRDNLHTGAINFIPPAIVLTDLLGETPSDNWLVQLTGDDVLPDMFIGRLSVQTAAQAETAVSKLIEYDDLPLEPGWQQAALLVADDDSPDFVSISEQVAGQLPTNFSTGRVYAANYPPGNPTEAIINGINAGALLVNYSGHGSVNRWGVWSGGDIFQQSDVAGLANGRRLPFVTIANCLNGFFTQLGSDESLAETLQRSATGGAVGVWAATGLGYPSGHRELMRQFYNAVFSNGIRELGAATTEAKLNTLAQSESFAELVQTFALFGDPATGLKTPSQPNTSPASIYLPVVIRSH
ncbi:MAG: hypothetical protein FOGNACKC_03167 [Anaerolineae bacterium]|nr:hypothetical protein [Anaerolineae bacterium]